MLPKVHEVKDRQRPNEAREDKMLFAANIIIKFVRFKRKKLHPETKIVGNSGVIFHDNQY